MTIEYKIKATPVFKLCLKKLDSFLTRKFNKSVAIEAKQSKQALILSYHVIPILHLKVKGFWSSASPNIDNCW